MGDVVPVQFDLPPLLILGPFLAGVVIYLLLRFVIWAPGTGTTPETVSEHALWVGVLGWMASSLQGSALLGIIPADPARGAGLTAPETAIPALAWPILGPLAIHAIGQISYPGPRRLRRKATLSVRRIRDFLPRRLAWSTAAIFAAAGVAIAWTATLPGVDPIPVTVVPDGPGGFRSIGGSGRVSGTALAGWLGAALLVLTAGTWLVLWLIARRRQLESLDAADNAVLRSIAMNRLLRTAATVAAGLGAISGNFAVQPDPAVMTGSWINPFGIVATLVLLIMWWWRPPRLAAAELGVRNRPEAGVALARQHPAARFASSLGPLLGLAAGLPLLAGVVASFFPASAPAGSGVGLSALVTAMAALVLFVIAAGELVLHRNYGRRDAAQRMPQQAVGPAMLVAAALSFLVYLVVLILTAVGQAGRGGTPDWAPMAALTALAVAAALPAVLAARFRRGVARTAGGADAALRAITFDRVVRTLAAAFTAQSAVLLLTQGAAWARVLGPDFLGGVYADPAAGFWPASAAGAVLAGAAVLITVLPVRTVTGIRRPPALTRKEPAA